MVEWCGESNLVHCTEILTLDERNNLSGGFPINTYVNPMSMPIESVGRIYASNRNTTGFLYKSPLYGLVVLSAHSSYATSFDSASPTNINIVFNLDHNYNEDKDSPHTQHPDYRKLKPISKNLNTQLIQNDPISECPYSLPNDIIIYEILNVCICGSRVFPVQAGGLEIIDYKKITNTEVILLGYPGLLSSQNSFPLKTGLTLEETEEMHDSMKENQLVWTEGHIEKKGDLLAISNSSAGGMSGSPLLTYINNNWKVVGMLIGGPDVVDHYNLMKLAACVKNDEMFNQWTTNITSLQN